MEGTIISIVRMLRSGNATPSEIADSIGISREQLVDRLALMERQGYLIRQQEVAPGPDCGCGLCCSSCGNQDSASAPVIFILTPKGERLAQNDGST